jgi:opacity protein-like surface antigen
MKRTFLLLASALLMASMAPAQDMPGNSTAGSAQYQNPDATTRSSASAPSVIRGCLSGSPGNYTLTDQNGMQYQVAGDDATLRSMVGREVEITATENPASEASSQGGETTSHASNSLQASEVRAVSPTCRRGTSVDTLPSQSPDKQ